MTWEAGNDVMDQKNRGGWVRSGLICMAGLLLVVSAAAYGQSGPKGDETAPASDSTIQSDVSDEAAVSTSDDIAEEADAPVELKVPKTYGCWVLAPAFVAIFLAILMRSVVPALAIGILVGAFMMIPCLPPAERLSDWSVIAGVRLAVERYMLGSLLVTDAKGHLMVVLFTLIIGGMVGCISANGGTRALVNGVSRYASSSRRGQLTGWFAGLIVFFDDYANSMIVGPTLRPMYDKLKISRAKLAYIVDSTAAPVASIALIGTWIGAELGFIDDGLKKMSEAGMPAFLEGADSMTVFTASIPYRFYPLLALWMVFVVAITCRDFGPMRRSESAALGGDDDDGHGSGTGHDYEEAKVTSGWLAAIPIMVLVLVTLVILYTTGAAEIEPLKGTRWEQVQGLLSLEHLRAALSEADSYQSILYGAISSFAVAVFLTFGLRACSIRHAMDGALDGMSRMFPAVVVLVLAWSLSSVSKDLQMGEVAANYLEHWRFPAVWLPLAVFGMAAVMSFAMGSSWATMGILTPAVVQIAANMGGEMQHADALNMFYASVGSVLAGAVFGDHCSPISDTTVLSSVASSCSVEEHVWTQLPYAMVVAIVGMGAGNYYCMHYGKPAWMGLAIGAGALLFIVLLIGRRPVAPVMIPGAPRVAPERVETRLRGDIPLSTSPGLGSGSESDSGSGSGSGSGSISGSRHPGDGPPQSGSGLV